MVRTYPSIIGTRTDGQIEIESSHHVTGSGLAPALDNAGYMLQTRPLGVLQGSNYGFRKLLQPALASGLAIYQAWVLTDLHFNRF